MVKLETAETQPGPTVAGEVPASTPSVPSTPAAPVPTAAALSGRVLLADDSPSNQKLLALVLGKSGLDVTVAENGRAACEAVQQAAHAGRPFDLLVMDMQMPEMNGYAAVSQLRAQGFAMPIIALTGDALPGDREKCLRAGCTDYLSKPASRAQVVDAVARQLSRGSGGKPVVAGAAAVSAGAPAPADREVAADPGLHSTLSDDPDTMPLVERFVATLPQQVAQLVASAGAGDLTTLAAALHGLKGSGGLYGFVSVATAARELEERIHGGPMETEALIAAAEGLAQLVRTVEGYEPAGETWSAEVCEPSVPVGLVDAKPAAPDGPADGPADGARTVLVVDDMAIVRDPVSASLRAAGHKTVCVASGREAVAALRHGQRFDLVLLDVLMPGMSGLAVLEYLRKDMKDARTPVILLTAAERRRDVVAAAKLGISGYLLKSQFSLRDLLERVRRQFEAAPPHPATPPTATARAA